MQALCTFGIKMLFFLSICRFGEPQVSNLHVCSLRMIRFFLSIFLFQYVSNYFLGENQIRIVLISSLIFDTIFIVIQNIDNSIILRILII